MVRLHGPIEVREGNWSFQHKNQTETTKNWHVNIKFHFFFLKIWYFYQCTRLETFPGIFYLTFCTFRKKELPFIWPVFYLSYSGMPLHILSCWVNYQSLQRMDTVGVRNFMIEYIKIAVIIIFRNMIDLILWDVLCDISNHLIELTKSKVEAMHGGIIIKQFNTRL